VRSTVVLLMTAVVAGCAPVPQEGTPGTQGTSGTGTDGTHGAQPSVPSTPAAADSLLAGTTAEDVAADLAQLEDQVLRIHPEGLRAGAALPTTTAALGDRDAAAVLATAMQALAGRPADGHTGVFPTAQDDLPMWPLQLYDFDDGWRVVAADADHQHLVGREVTAIGGRETGEVARLVEPLVPHDTPASRRGRLPLFLVVPDVLRGVGVEPSLELDGEPVEPVVVPAAAYAERFGLFSPLVCPGLPRPSEPDWAIKDRDRAVVLRYRRVDFSSDGTGHETLADDLERRLSETGATRLVLDLRDNPGGELPAAAPLVEVAQRFAAEHPGGLRLLAGRCTFSAAALTVAELLATTDAVLVGEDVGGSPGIWADPRTVTLPRTGLVAHVARTWYPPAADDLPVRLTPDVAVPVRWSERVAGTDPALAAALAD